MQYSEVIANPNIPDLAFKIELKLHFPNDHQVIIKFGHQESEILTFQAPVVKKDLEDLRWYIEVYAA